MLPEAMFSRNALVNQTYLFIQGDKIAGGHPNEQKISQNTEKNKEIL